MFYQISALKVLTLVFLSSIALSCGTFTNTPTVQISNYNPICIAISYNTSSASNKYVQYYFKTRIDQLSSLQLTNISTLFSNATKAIATVYYQNISINFTIIDTSQSILRHFVSIVINLEDGLVTSIVGDNFCDSSCTCVNSECYESSSAGYGSSDLVFYVSWAGKDSKGTFCASSTMRFSRYNLYSVSDVSSQLKKYIAGLSK